MSIQSRPDYRIEKRRMEAVLRLSNGDTVSGCFFTADSSARHAGPERIGDVLNGDSPFFPFELRSGGEVRTVLYNREHVVTVTVSDDEPRQDPGYGVATRRVVSMLLSTGQRLSGAVRVYRPQGLDRLSDWPKGRDNFLYLETDAFTFIVNGAHLVEIAEVSE